MAACWFLMGGIIGLFFNSISQFVVPITEALGISRASFSLITSFNSLAAMLMSLIVGKAYAKFKPRLVAAVGGASAVLGWLGLSFAQNAAMLHVAGFLMGIGCGLCGSVIVNTLLTNWFHEKQGFVISFASTGSGFASMLFNPLIAKLVGLYGYKTAVHITGFILLAIIVIFLLIFSLKPSDKGLLPYGETEPAASLNSGIEKPSLTQDGPSASGYTQKEALKSPAFWAICAIVILMAIGTQSLSTHMTPFFMDKGYDALHAASFMSVVSLSMMAAKILIGVLDDKIGSFKTILLTTALSAIGIASLAFSGISSVMGYISAAGFGIAFATPNTFAPLLTIHAMGEKDFTNILGLVTCASYIGTFISSPLSGAIHDATGSYEITNITCTISYIVIFILAYFVLRKRRK